MFDFGASHKGAQETAMALGGLEGDKALDS
jgi:hypothetical protein